MFSRRVPSLLLRASVRHSSTAPVPPLLATLQADLKTAMRSKNQLQLSVLRSLLAEIKNAQLTNNPPNDDVAILQIINKSRASFTTFIAECRSANRQDLVEKEEAQLAVLDGYANSVKILGKDEILAGVEKVVARLQGEGVQLDMTSVMRAVTKEFEGKPVVMRDVADAVKKVLRK
ncbi:Yqey-like protein-domain-containing protein [Trichophaea hybrida]|nr:Yqey-like protein-domain-containing protein [Trichophaea hybrida]